ncbi:DMT family transporter [Catellatospora methionotrophica]|uniref:DMT family transporter n=1 Tax=Catellatospora methionotrophica TaxID=121620 RepID=UPI0033FACCC3
MNKANGVRLALLALLWGSSFLWIKLALRGFSPVQLVFLRLLLGFAVLAPIVMLRRLPVPQGITVWAHLFVAALIANAVPYVLFGIGEQTVDSSVAGVLNATTPLWTVVVAYLAGTDRAVTFLRAGGIALGFLGTILIFSPWESAGEIASPGGLACLAASASYGVSYVYMGRFLAGRGIAPLTLSAGQLGAATVLLALALPVSGGQAITWRVDAVASVVVLGVLGTGAAYVLNYRLIADVGPTAASVVTYLLPAVAVVLGAVFLAETPTAAMVGGTVLVLAGVLLTQRAGKPRRS